MNSPTHDIAASTRWFNQWQGYRAILDHDWMRHAAITSAIRRCLKARSTAPFTAVDLGCGDADPALRVFQGTALATYVGVDASPAAIEEAAGRLAAAGWRTTLLRADATAEIARRATAGLLADVIVAGYLVHHLPPDRKKIFFADCRRTLAPNGNFFYYDIHRLPDTTRGDWLDAYITGIRQWQPLAATAFEAIRDHVLKHDFPETESFIFGAAAEAGFRVEDSLVYADDTGFHRLYRLQGR